MKTFNLPDLGEGLQEAEIVTWHVAVGDHVVEDQPLVSVETAKAVVEIPSPQSGQIMSIHGAIGDIVGTGEPLVDFEMDGGGKSESVVGELPHPAVEKKVRSSTISPAVSVVRAVPAARRLARELDVNLSKVEGSGPEGAVTLNDVRQYAEGVSEYSDGEPLRGPRRAMANAMAKAGKQVVSATVTEIADIEIWNVDEDPTTRLVQAIVAGCIAEPRLNAWLDGSGGRVLVHDKVDIGIAMDRPDGLFVPVLRDAQNLDSAMISDKLKSLKQSVKQRTIEPSELQRQTITLSNFGMIGGIHAALVVVPPQVAILGAGRIEARAVVRKGKLVAARTLPLSLSFDHRAVTGGEATRFLSAVVVSLQADHPS